MSDVTILYIFKTTEHTIIYNSPNSTSIVHHNVILYQVVIYQSIRSYSTTKLWFFVSVEVEMKSS
jgi:hypothetical protein